MTCKLFDFDFITASSFCHHDIMTMSSLGYMKKITFMSMRLKKVLNMKNLIYF